MKKERTINELYEGDPERADALVFGRVPDMSRRGFLGGAGLAAVSAAVGGAIPFAANMPGGLVPAALAQGQPSGTPSQRKCPLHRRRLQTFARPGGGSPHRLMRCGKDLCPKRHTISKTMPALLNSLFQPR
jgi:hypothetical protein